MSNHSIEQVWLRIIQHEGEVFHTKNCCPFTYTVSGNVLVTSRTVYNLSKSNFKKALDKVPLVGPGEIAKVVRGHSYVWAILHDKRVSQGEW